MCPLTNEKGGENMPRASYQYGTSPRKYEPEYTPRTTAKKVTKKVEKVVVK